MQNKLLIIEGQDNCGKTTIMRKLRNKIKNPKIISLSSSAPPEESFDDWSIKHYSNGFYTIMDLVKNEGFDIICDRFHIGETVYGPIYRDAQCEYIWELEKEVYNSLQDQIYLLVLIDDGDKILSREDGYSIEQSSTEFDIIRQRFKAGYNNSTIKNKMLIDISKDGWPNTQKIYNWIYK